MPTTPPGAPAPPLTTGTFAQTSHEADAGPWAFGWDAVASLATAAAVVVAIGAVLFDLWRTRREREERRAGQAEIASERAKRDRAEVRHQAEHVVAWFDVVVHYEDEHHGYGPYSGTETLSAHNASDSPVYEIAVVHRWSSSLEEVVFVRAVLGPSPSPVILIKSVRDPYEDGPPDRARSELRSISFRDSAGRWWRRDQDGDLHPLDTRPTYDGLEVVTASSG